MSKQGVNKTAGKRGRGKPFTGKDDPRRGVGVKGRSGRKPDAFKKMCQALASSADVEKAVKTILKTPTHPAFVGALKWASENGYGKPEQPITGAGGGPVEIRVSYDKGGPEA